MSNIEEIGFIDKGTGKHQSNVVYMRGIAPTITASTGIKTSIMIIDLVYATTSHTALTQTILKESHLSNS